MCAGLCAFVFSCPTWDNRAKMKNGMSNKVTALAVVVVVVGGGGDWRKLFLEFPFILAMVSDQKKKRIPSGERLTDIISANRSPDVHVRNARQICLMK